MSRTGFRLFRKSNSRFWQASYVRADGTSVDQESTRLTDKKAAQAWLDAKQLAFGEGQKRTAMGIPVAIEEPLIDAAEDYLDEHESPVWAKKWHKAVDGFFAVAVIPYFGEARPVSTIQPDEVARFRTCLIGRPDVRFKTSCCRKKYRLSSAQAWVCESCGNPFTEGKTISSASVNRLFWALAAFGAWCVERKYSLTNPWRGQESLPEDQVPPPSVDDADLEKLLLALEDPTGPLPSHGRRKFKFPWRALFEFANETGLRSSELGRLARADVEKAERRAWIVSSGSRGHNKGRKLRSVALSLRALAILEELPERKDGLVFGPVPDPRRAFETAARATGMQRVWLHLMRHTAATRIGRTGAGLADLMAFGGWASHRMAMRYTHTDHRRQLELVDRAAARDATPSPAASPEQRRRSQ